MSESREKRMGVGIWFRIIILVPIIIVASATAILFSSWLRNSTSQNPNYISGLEENRILRLKYKFITGLIEIEPGEVLELRQLAGRNATLNVEIERSGNNYTLNFTIYVEGHSVYSEDGKRVFREFRKCTIFEYDAATEKFYWQGRDVGVLLPLFQPVEDKIILFSAEFIPLGVLEPEISSYPPPSSVWASKVFTIFVYLKEGKVCIPELNRTWLVSELPVEPPVWSVYEALSKLAGNDTLEITYYCNNTIWGMPSVFIERNTGIITSMRIPGLLRTLNNTRITVNDELVNVIPLTPLSFFLGLEEEVFLELMDIEVIP
ncbi:MAG: hypothetical protein QXI42_00875 [Thermoproteota archaeon]|nr:hypothetical protein [Candidatus Brockarchaeota archaeon]